MKVAAVGDICEQIRGVTYAKSDASDVSQTGYSPILRANNIGADGLIFEDFVFVPNNKISPKQRIAPNDILVAASSGSLSVVGKTAQAREGFDGGFGAFCKVLRPGPDVDPHYFGHYFRTPMYRHIVSHLAAGANINNLKNEHLDNLQIPFPPLAEQKRIAGILDAADALRAKRRESLAQLDTLLQSTFLDMFGDPVTNPIGWDVKTLEEFISPTQYSLKRGPFGGALKKEIFVKDGFKVYQQQNVIYEDFTSGSYFISARDYNRLIAFAVQSGDLLISCSGTIGRIAVVPKGARAGVMNQALLKIRLNESKMLTTFFLGLWKSSSFERQVLGMTHGTGMKNMKSMKELKAIKFMLPPVDTQHRFATVVESVGQQKARQLAHLAELDTLFASLQARAFRGDL